MLVIITVIMVTFGCKLCMFVNRTIHMVIITNIIVVIIIIIYHHDM